MPYEREEGINVGVDVGKFQLDVHERVLAFSAPQTPAGVRTLLSLLVRFKLARVVVEATGRREYDLVIAAAERGLPVVVAQPLTIRRYAAAKGVLAKTDRLDAQVLADYATTLRPEVRPIPVGPIREMNDLAARRRQLVTMSTMEKYRLDVIPAACRPTCVDISNICRPNSTSSTDPSISSSPALMPGATSASYWSQRLASVSRWPIPCSPICPSLARF